MPLQVDCFLNSNKLVFYLTAVHNAWLSCTLHGHTEPTTSMYNRLGGVFGIAAIVDLFSNRLLDNPIIGKKSKNPHLAEWSNVQAPTRLAGLKVMRTLWLCDVSGGPMKFAPSEAPTVEKQDALNLDVQHCPFRITDAEFDEVVRELSQAMFDLKVAQSDADQVVVAFKKHRQDVTEGSRREGPCPFHRAEAKQPESTEPVVITYESESGDHMLRFEADVAKACLPTVILKEATGGPIEDSKLVFKNGDVVGRLGWKQLLWSIRDGLLKWPHVKDWIVVLTRYTRRPEEKSEPVEPTVAADKIVWTSLLTNGVHFVTMDYHNRTKFGTPIFWSAEESSNNRKTIDQVKSIVLQLRASLHQ